MSNLLRNCKQLIFKPMCFLLMFGEAYGRILDLKTLISLLLIHVSLERSTLCRKSSHRNLIGFLSMVFVHFYLVFAKLFYCM